jgi:hypothetical protein
MRSPSLRRVVCVSFALALLACKAQPAAEPAQTDPADQAESPTLAPETKPWVLDRFADVQILRY